MKPYSCGKYRIADFQDNDQVMNQLNEVKFINEHIEEGELRRKSYIKDMLLSAKKNTKFHSRTNRRVTYLTCS